MSVFTKIWNLECKKNLRYKIWNFRKMEANDEKGKKNDQVMELLNRLKMY